MSHLHGPTVPSIQGEGESCGGRKEKDDARKGDGGTHGILLFPNLNKDNFFRTTVMFIFNQMGIYHDNSMQAHNQQPKLYLQLYCNKFTTL